MAIVVNEMECIGCGFCVFLCPEDALRVPSSIVVEVNRDTCTECLTCLNCCPCDALGED